MYVIHMHYVLTNTRVHACAHDHAYHNMRICMHISCIHEIELRMHKNLNLDYVYFGYQSRHTCMHACMHACMHCARAYRRHHRSYPVPSIVLDYAHTNTLSFRSAAPGLRGV